jgi:hypothetical protein
LCGELGFRRKGEKRGGGRSSRGSGEDERSAVFFDRGIQVLVPSLEEGKILDARDYGRL